MSGLGLVYVYVIIEKSVVKFSVICFWSLGFLLRRPAWRKESRVRGLHIPGGSTRLWSEHRSQQPFSWKAALICSQRHCSDWGEAPTNQILPVGLWVFFWRSSAQNPEVAWSRSRLRSRVKTIRVSSPALWLPGPAPCSRMSWQVGCEMRVWVRPVPSLSHVCYMSLPAVRAILFKNVKNRFLRELRKCSTKQQLKYPSSPPVLAIRCVSFKSPFF